MCRALFACLRGGRRCTINLTMTSALRWRVFVFAAIAINLIAFLMVRLAPRPAVGIGAALDVAVTVPALYWLAGDPRRIAAAGIAGAAVPVGGGARDVSGARDRVGAARGGGGGGIRGGRPDRRAPAPRMARRGSRSRRTGADRSRRPRDRSRRGGSPPSSSSEIAVFYYAFASWRRSPDVP